MTEIFVDTGAWVALADTKDQFHKQAQTILNRIDKPEMSFITTNLVIHETAVLLARRGTHSSAVKFINTVYKNNRIKVIHCDEITEQKAYEIFNKYADQKLSVTDCVSFVTMKRLHIRRAFTFDKHFTIMGFIIEPAR